MIWTLVRKEVSEHWISCAALLAFLSFCSLLISIYVWLLEAGSVLDGHRVFMSLFVAMAALFINHRLVTIEYRGQTQLFLEALPVTRPVMITVKLLLGWLLLTVIGLLNLYWLAFIGRSDEPITSRFLALLTLRTIGYVSFVHLATFMMSMLGRYKISLYLALFISLTVFLEVTGFELGRFGPIGLIWDRMEYENELVPWVQLRIAAAMCLGLLVVIYSLALVREGALAGMLAEKMSQREKLFITASLLTGLAMTGLADKLAKPEPFELVDMHVAQVGRIQVATSTNDELAQYLGEQLEAVCEYLRIEHPPKVWVTDRKDLDVHRYERGELKDQSSLLLRANVQHPKFNRLAFAAFAIHEFLDVHTQGRVRTEAKVWYWDGFGLYWLKHAQPNQDSEQARLRAAVAFHDQPLTEKTVRQWRQYRRAVGDDLAQATAAFGLATLVREVGPEAARAFFSRLFQGEVGDDLRATWFEVRNSNASLFASFTKLAYADFIDRWLTELSAEAKTRENSIAALTAPTGTLTLARGEHKAQLHYAIESSGQTARPAISILYVRLKPFDVEPAPHQIQRFDIDNQSTSGDVDEFFDQGESILATLRVFDHQLGCERISGWKVLRVP